MLAQVETLKKSFRFYGFIAFVAGITVGVFAGHHLWHQPNPIIDLSKGVVPKDTISFSLSDGIGHKKVWMYDRRREGAPKRICLACEELERKIETLRADGERPK